MVTCLRRGADLHMAQLMPLTIFCFHKIQIGFTFLIPVHLGSPGQRAVKLVLWMDVVVVVVIHASNTCNSCMFDSGKLLTNKNVYVVDVFLRKSHFSESLKRKAIGWITVTVLNYCKIMVIVHAITIYHKLCYTKRVMWNVAEISITQRCAHDSISYKMQNLFFATWATDTVSCEYYRSQSYPHLSYSPKNWRKANGKMCVEM